ncbi:Catechol 2,3-dioxygenase [Chishuiella changwenlii]|uniref:Catechol 2,3-dioxygenase n=1 Tax=Chishuiella changwenlii TaxID=1434701 RepID=A0A1M7B211_9FLAO|nr:VOC family protein [Chishuiella changwenlii]GGE95579.1 lactoylglutathione lyase [Chishuiella changwenlii]SHL48971.1 Catechol 2,3-dioxygenase [Chishuiella changwenlii]
MIKFQYTILYVEDVTKSIEFYENSFGFEGKFITPENDYGELNTGETTISFASKTLATSNLKNGFVESNISQKPFAIELGLVTDDVEKYINQAIQNGAIIEQEAKQKPWGQTVAYIRDIDGFLIELCTPMHG